MAYHLSMNVRGGLRLLGIVAMVGCIAGCGTPLASLFPRPTPEPLQQRFGPTFPADPPTGPLARLDDATLLDDGDTLAITFVGGKGYDPDNVCSEDYQPWVQKRGDELAVAVARVHPPDQRALGDNMSCTLEGYGYTFLLELAQPFAGSTVRDLAGGMLWVRAPSGLAELRALPPGWTLQRQYDEPLSAPPLWVRNYTIDGAAPVPNNGRENLFLYQSFDGATSIGGGDVIHSVTVNGEKVLLYEDSRTGELILQWRIGEIGLAIDANLADFTIDDLLELAESAELPAP